MPAADTTRVKPEMKTKPDRVLPGPTYRPMLLSKKYRSIFFFAFFLPLFVACASGGYLFYAQHNFVGMRVLPGTEWSYYSAALASSSYLRTGALARWFTGNIGYHHVHNLSNRIPNYRLKECFQRVPELQRVTRLTIRSSLRSARLHLWDEDRGRLVGFRHLRAAEAGA